MFLGFRQLMALFCIFAVLEADAYVLPRPTLQETSRLPKQGTWGASYNYSSISYSEYADDFGTTKKVDFGLSRSMTFGESVENVEESNDKTVIIGVYDDNGISNGTAFGNIEVDVNINRAIHSPSLSYSFTDYWQSQIHVPVYETNIAVDSTFKPSKELRALTRKGARKGISNKNKESFDKVTSDPLEMELENKGYNDLEEGSRNSIGDVTMKQRFRAYDDREVAVTVEQITTAPTGEPLNADDPVDISSGDGQWDLGAGVSFEMSPENWPVGLQFYGAYINQLPSQGERRIPETEGAPLTESKDESVLVDMGDIVQAQATTSLEVSTNIFFKSSYAMISKQKDRYSGSAFPQYRYDQLSDSTYKSMDLLLLGFQYSTFKYLNAPEKDTNWSGQLAYISVLSGENVMISDQWQFDVSLYF